MRLILTAHQHVIGTSWDLAAVVWNLRHRRGAVVASRARVSRARPLSARPGLIRTVDCVRNDVSTRY